MVVKDDISITDTNLRFYYKHLCPIKELVRWISYEDSNLLSKREVSFTYLRETSVDVSEIYLRWQSFENDQQFYNLLCDNDKVPFKFDIGAIYTKRISLMHLSGNEFRAVERELVFDIDMDDYDEFRTCCTEKKICSKCWRFIKIAVEMITSTLIEDFGYRNILWVYSGRRGIHCWVCDSNARKLPSDGRAAIIDYLNLITGGDGHGKKVHLYGLDNHPLILRAFKICYGNFHKLLQEQNFFKNKNHLHTLLEYFSDRYPQARKVINTAIDADVKDSVSFWRQICDAFGFDEPKDFNPNTFNKSTCNIPPTFIEAVIAFSYPRLDINVTKDIGHLLKAPFCVHAKTG